MHLGDNAALPSLSFRRKPESSASLAARALDPGLRRDDEQKQSGVTMVSS